MIQNINRSYQNISSSSYSDIISCSFLNNKIFYCVVCCSSDPSVPPDSSVYNISSTKGTEVTVSLQGLTSGQIYYCKGAATNTNTTHCAGPVSDGVKVYFSFVANLFPITSPTTCTRKCIVIIAMINFHLICMHCCVMKACKHGNRRIQFEFFSHFDLI